MISSIFGKTKPINFIILLTFLFVFYWTVHLFVFERIYTSGQITQLALVLAVLLFSFIIINFIIKRNKMTESNSFAMLFYTVLIVVFPETLLDNNAIFCSLFLLLASRRLISIRSLKEIKLKAFDATLWIIVASFFYDWAIVYLFLVFAAIYIYEPNNLKNWLVPFAASFTALMISYCVLILTGNTEELLTHYALTFNFDKAIFLGLVKSTKFVVYVIMILLLGIFAFLKLGRAGLGKTVTLRLIGLSFALGVLMEVLITSNESYPIMLTFFPGVVFMTNYVEAIKRPKIKEMLLVASILIPIFVLLLDVLA